MITYHVMKFFIDILGTVLGSVDLPGPPEWAVTPGAALGVVFQALGSMGVWFNLPLMALVIGSALVARLAGLGIKIARMILSLLSGGGGNAGP